MSDATSQNRPLDVLSAAVLKLLRPLVRVLLRYGVAYGTFADLAKSVYVSIAEEEFGIAGKKQTVSRMSVITGLSRKEVKRVRELTSPDDADTRERYNRAARVLTGWIRDPRFTGENGEPQSLVLESGERDFTELVKRYSGDVPPRAILDELARVGAVTIDDDGTISLETRGYIPKSGEIDKLEILGSDVADLIKTIDHNLTVPSEQAFFQRKVAYDNLPVQGTEQLQVLAANKSQELLESLDGWMAARDRDATPSASGKGRKRAILGIYYYEEEIPEDD